MTFAVFQPMKVRTMATLWRGLSISVTASAVGAFKRGCDHAGLDEVSLVAPQLRNWVCRQQPRTGEYVTLSVELTGDAERVPGFVLFCNRLVQQGSLRVTRVVELGVWGAME